MDAVREDNKSVVILLLAAGADVSLKDKWHKTALDIARNRHLKDIIDLIEKTKIVQ